VFSQVNVRVALLKLKPGMAARVVQLLYEYSIVFGYDELEESAQTSHG
jgi:hypothetical protein